MSRDANGLCVEQYLANVHVPLGEQQFAECGGAAGRIRVGVQRAGCVSRLHPNDGIGVIQGRQHQRRDHRTYVAVAPFRPVQQSGEPADRRVAQAGRPHTAFIAGTDRRPGCRRPR
jgi:hypothetical protein